MIFLNGGQVRSPAPAETLERPASAFGVTPAAVRGQLEALNGSLLNLVEDEEGPYWTYRHPTIADAFASYVAKSPELIEIYLRGAKPETIVQEVVCAGITRSGAMVTVPNSLHETLADRIASLPGHSLAAFISYRSNQALSKRLMALRPDLWARLDYFSRPLGDDLDADLLATLNQQGLLPEERRLAFVEEVRSAAVEDVDASFLENDGIAGTLTKAEQLSILEDVNAEVLGKLDEHVYRVRENWDRDYDPEEHFDKFRSSVKIFAEALSADVEPTVITHSVERLIESAVHKMRERYAPTSSSSATPTQQSAAKADSLDDIFRDVDE